MEMIIKGNLYEILMALHADVGRRQPSNANTVSNLWKAAQTAGEHVIIDLDTTPKIEATAGAVTLAEKNGVALEEVSGTGQDGKVTVNDVRRHLHGDDTEATEVGDQDQAEE
jgi:pyruvate/2-oxoglutarate dehydrogenase complex dihydrolipoamide acyltransferase (E2) component